MGAINANHQCATSTILTNLLCYLTEGIHKANCARCGFGLIIYLCATWSKFADVDAAASTITISTSQLFSGIINRLNIIFWRRNNIAVTICYLFIVNAAIAQDAPTEQEFLIGNKLCYICITTTYTIKPILKRFPITLVFLFPDINTKLIFFT